MKNTQLKFIAIVFVILGLAALFVRTTLYDPVKTTEKPLTSVGVQDIDSFQINNFTLGLLFKRVGDTNNAAAWQVKKFTNVLAEDLSKKAGVPLEDTNSEFYAANPVIVSKALAYLVEQTIGEPVATVINNLGTFEINEHSLHVILFDKNGTELDRIWIGKAGPDMMTSFVKKQDANSIFIVRQNLRDLFLRPLEYWLTPSDTEPHKK